jgi:hypothetical protein
MTAIRKMNDDKGDLRKEERVGGERNRKDIGTEARDRRNKVC